MNKKSNTSTKYVMVESSPSIEKDEIDLPELIYTLLQAWKVIVSITIVCTGLAIAYALSLPEVFKAETLLAPAEEEKSQASSALGQFGGLAAMAGISIPASSNIERVLATLQTREFLKKFIEKRNLLPIIFSDLWSQSSQTWELVDREEPTLDEGWSVVQNAIEVEDEQSGLITLTITWKDPDVAANWANDLVMQLNEQLREEAIMDSKKKVGYLEQELAKTTLKDMRAVLYNLLETEKQKAMLANVNEDFALKVIDPAFAFRGKSNGKLIIALGMVGGGFISIFIVLFRQFLQKLILSISDKKVNNE